MKIFSFFKQTGELPKQKLAIKQCTPSYPYSAALQHFLYGKLLLLDELPFSQLLIEQHLEHGYLAAEPGMFHIGQPLCARCGNDSPRRFATYPCFTCQRECFYCRHCLMLGRISSCTLLYRWTGPAPHIDQISNPLEWQGTLSSWQEKAAIRVKVALEQREKLLIWAVCGAGKTEILFPGIEHALSQGLSVCLATPRTDVVLELAPRFTKVFPTTEIAALYGGSKDLKRTSLAPLTIATTHQLLRFAQAFDVLILDEVDAFPYSVDKTLQYAANRAKKRCAAEIYLTATPSSQLKKQAAAGKLPFVRIPRRFHGHPLPVPEFRWCGDWKKQLRQGRLPRVVQEWLEWKRTEQRQALLFVPSIEVMEQVAEIVKKYFSNCTSIHAEDEQRIEKMKQFRNGELQFLVTTTILERGVTIPRLDVAVLGADADIFTESALVQIAGRVGRSHDAPIGDVLFYHFGKTKAMVDAKQHILFMNQEGARTDELLPPL